MSVAGEAGIFVIRKADASIAKKYFAWAEGAGT